MSIKSRKGKVLDKQIQHRQGVRFLAEKKSIKWLSRVWKFIAIRRLIFSRMQWG